MPDTASLTDTMLDHGQRMRQIGFERGYSLAVTEALSEITNCNFLSATEKLALFDLLGRLKPGEVDRPIATATKEQST